MQSHTPRWIKTPQTGLQINSVATSADGQLTIAGTSSEFGFGQFNFYGYNADGTERWQVAVTAANATQGVFWVALNSAGTVAAAGGESSKACGFLTIVDGQSGAILLQDSRLNGRVNQLSFSDDGLFMLAGLGNELRLYQCIQAKWQLVDSFIIASQYVSESAVLSCNGQRVWVSAIDYHVTPYSGLVLQLPIVRGRFGSPVSYPQPCGVMRMVTTADGELAAGALHTGGCALFQAGSSNTAAVLTPNIADLQLAYAIGMTQLTANQVVIVVGANTKTAGVLYRVDAQLTAAQTVPPCWSLDLSWHSATQYGINPGVTLDAMANKVTATDGKPNEQHGGHNHDESPGHFYLFDACTGNKLWHYVTTYMNWPMQITKDGATAVGGSDDGSVYYWKL